MIQAINDTVLSLNNKIISGISKWVVAYFGIENCDDKHDLDFFANFITFTTGVDV